MISFVGFIQVFTRTKVNNLIIRAVVILHSINLILRLFSCRGKNLLQGSVIHLFLGCWTGILSVQHLEEVLHLCDRLLLEQLVHVLAVEVLPAGPSVTLVAESFVFDSVVKLFTGQVESVVSTSERIWTEHLTSLKICEADIGTGVVWLVLARLQAVPGAGGAPTPHVVTCGADAAHVWLLTIGAPPTQGDNLLHRLDEHHDDGDIVPGALVLGHGGQPRPDVLDVSAGVLVLLEVDVDDLGSLLRGDSVPEAVTPDDQELVRAVVD